MKGVDSNISRWTSIYTNKVHPQHGGAKNKQGAPNHGGAENEQGPPSHGGAKTLASVAALVLLHFRSSFSFSFSYRVALSVFSDWPQLALTRVFANVRPSRFLEDGT